MDRNSKSAVQFNVASRLTEFAKSYPDKKILVFPYRAKFGVGHKISYRDITFAQLENNVNRLANSLREAGLKNGDRVVVMVPMSIELYIVVITLLKMGAITVFIDPWVGLKQIIHCCELTQPTAFIGIRKSHLLRIFSNVLRRIPVKIVTNGPAFFGETILQNLLDSGKPEFQTEPVCEEDTALITFTTGSTGTPKGANRTHGFLLAQQKVLSESIKLTPQDIDLPALPIFVLKNMANNVTSVLPLMNFLKPSEVNPDWILQQFRDWNVTTSIGSPAFFEPIARFCLERKIKLEKVRAIFTGGGPVKPELIEMLTKILPNGTANIVYGSTEAEPISLISAKEILTDSEHLTKTGQGNCVGSPIEDIEVRIIKIQDVPINFKETDWDRLLLPQDKIGEIIVTGNHVNKDYYKNPEAVRENKFMDEQGFTWHRTGDTGYFDVKGRLWLVGRVKNRVIRAGQEMYPLQIEPLVNQLPFVKLSALIGLPNHKLGQKAILIVETTEKGFFKLKRWKEQIKDLCLKKGWRIDEIYFSKHIPVDPRHNAKIDYEKLRKRYRGRSLFFESSE